MSKRKDRPSTPAAKGEAAILANCRRIYPDFDSEVVRFGLLVAVFNAGAVKGMKIVERKNRKR